MTKQPGDEGDKPQLKVSMLKDKGTEKRAVAGVEWRQYTTPIAILIVGVIIVAAILLGRVDIVPITPTNTPAEVGTIQAQETRLALLVTPSLDPNVVALQTQNAQLIQNATDQAGTSQAVPTQEVQIVTATLQQPAVQPTVIIVVPPTQQPPRIITATPKPPTNVPPPPTKAPNPTENTQNTIYNCPDYRPTGVGKSLTIDINIPDGQIAFIDAYSFDDGVDGFFVTITGPYRGTHTIRDGAYCGDISVTDDYQPVMQQRIDAAKQGGEYVEIHLGKGS